MDVSTYTEEFHKMTLKAKMPENEKQKLARYLNGLKFSIKDELNLFNSETVHKCFQMALRIEDKQRRKGDFGNSSKGRGNQNLRGRGRFQNRDNFSRLQGGRSQEGNKGRLIKIVLIRVSLGAEVMAEEEVGAEVPMCLSEGVSLAIRLDISPLGARRRWETLLQIRKKEEYNSFKKRTVKALQVTKQPLPSLQHLRVENASCLIDPSSCQPPRSSPKETTCSEPLAR